MTRSATSAPFGATLRREFSLSCFVWTYHSQRCSSGPKDAAFTIYLHGPGFCLMIILVAVNCSLYNCFDPPRRHQTALRTWRVPGRTTVRPRPRRLTGLTPPQRRRITPLASKTTMQQILSKTSAIEFQNFDNLKKNAFRTQTWSGVHPPKAYEADPPFPSNPLHSFRSRAPKIKLHGLGSDVPPVGFGAKPQPESNLVHFNLKIWHPVAIILMIFLKIGVCYIICLLYVLVDFGFLFPLH